MSRHVPKVCTVANSSEAARQTQERLEAINTQQFERFAAAQQETATARLVAVTAARGEAKAAALGRFHENAVRRGQDHAALLATLKCWTIAVVESKHTAKLKNALREAGDRERLAVERVRLESLSALQQAWSDMAEVSRKAAAHQRRCECLEIESRDMCPPSSIATARCGSHCGEARPTTAADIEQRLKIADQNVELVRIATAQRLEASQSQPTTSQSRPSTARIFPGEAMGDHPPPEVFGAAEVLRIEDRCGAFEVDHLAQRDLCSFLRWRSEAFRMWRLAVSDEKTARALNAVRNEAQQNVIDAREGRRGLFVAALGQQPKHYQSRALGAWRRVILQGRCENLELASREMQAVAVGTPRGTAAPGRRGLVVSTTSPKGSGLSLGAVCAVPTGRGSGR